MNRFSRLTTGQEDVQAEAHDWPIEFFEKRIWHVRRPVPEPELVREVVKMLKAAKRPLIISGGSVRFVGINVAPMDANKLSARAIVADAKRALNALRGELKEAGYAGTQVEYRNEIRNLKEVWDAKVTELRTPQEGPGALALIASR
jgi:TPP-dependent trihydroxycyclohexane-1,2-dione (THcHDO) dehydratase